MHGDDHAFSSSREPVIDRFQYLGLMIACLVLTLPLELVIGARVWRRPARLARAVLPVAAGFIVLTLPTGLLFGWLAKRKAVRR